MIDLFIGSVLAMTLPTPAQAQTVLQPLLIAGDMNPPKIVRAIAPTKKRANSVGVKTTGASVFVADIASGKVLYSKDAHRVMPIASITKLVTAMVFLDQKPDMTRMVTFQSADFDREGKAVFKVGDQITNEDLLRSLLIGSVNASANVMARTSLGMEEFVVAMNAKTRELGLKTPRFVEPSGIRPENQASAADVAAILSIASGYPDIRRITQSGDFEMTVKNTNQKMRIISTNLLLTSYLNKGPYKIVAAKTGSLPEAGYCMAQVTRNAAGNEIIAVELGNENHFSRYNDIKALTGWAFETYQWER